ncbi:MAG: tRNA (guanosine(46)-N7)-methyltransferase TrmB [Thermoanaerobaculia bacterium]
MLPMILWCRGAERALDDLSTPLPLPSLVPGEGPWEVEIGFGKGRELLRRAEAFPERRFLGIEMVSRYYRMVRDRARRRGLENLVLIRGEALYLLAVAVEPELAEVVHVYFPDPWPKARHHKRRLVDPESVDLVLRLLRPGGELCFATDFIEYGEEAEAILRRQPGLSVERLADGWPEGPRTTSEAKYVREGRPIVRLVARRKVRAELPLHPAGRSSVLAAVAGDHGVTEGAS